MLNITPETGELRRMVVIAGNRRRVLESGTTVCSLDWDRFPAASTKWMAMPGENAPLEAAYWEHIDEAPPARTRSKR